ncbi:EVI5-like protein isoform X1 [Panthera pardus]|uniref:EVI5-like protein isoform X1 n=3 Tax=Felidae TaxID=9681 RepID=A0A9W2V5S3_PANPR|nr:EVI5-like protein isoform X5 [Felis catus]XP_023100434.1 EVI5-like protein isoform X5 [Felis catus]XP_023100440.1 EVI5-like protein isoform X5 [Felis catus]XP_030154779.1 EVI5-like protein isoform X1 [Lynx canadensis]XP_032446990.1 EVI5-like protein isoform X1 [Lynx canadensis]XP_046952258.1 EVI5-like protein isoform X3 [Lynx rufus]XP_049495773.1 EVI5-like protein [Panthera uncia]XP_053754020.1 EVI5-like protein isoform X1 [Panthera pardus]XP_053754021.1 EVI5-like protein isoform X1 [Pan
MASPTLSPDSSSQEALSAPTCSPTSDSENLSPDELELLAKLEEQNRLLEADSKSMRSMNGSRRNSGSSLVSSSSASSNLSHLEEDTWILWGRIANEWEEWRRRKEKLLKELIRKGIPHHFRAIVWQLLCSATDMPVKNQYSELLKMSSPCEKLIRRDIARTYPEHEFFKGQDSLGQEVLFNVMKAYSLVDREVGYCQGSAFIVGLLLMQMPEEEAFCVFVRLMQEYRLRELFKPSMAELGLCIYQFESMLQEQLPDLNTHFRSQSFHTSMYASSWFLTLFLTTFPLPVATRVFDIFMYEGLEIVFRVGLALLQVNQTELMQLDMEGMSQYFQRVIPHQFDSCPDKLILKAYQVKYNPKKMKRLEKEYAAMKSKEMEEQIEIKRLRTENRLLKQRIETLEKESAALADRLIQGQVTRAQEAEENYVIKRELAVVRQQCSSAAEDLQKARSTIRQLQEQQPSACPQDNPRLTEDFVAHLETELEQSRLRETETLGALREMQDKVLDMEKRNSSLPDENNVARLQEELKALKVREGEAVASARELKLQLQELSDTWQAHLSRGGRWKESPRKLVLGELQDELMSVRLREAQALAEGRELRQRVVELETQDHIHRNLLNRVEAERAALQEKLQYLAAQNKGLQTQLSESRRKQAEAECKSKEEVMAVRLREADSMAAVAEMRQRIAELEIQREEGRIQGQLNHSDSSQYIRELKDQIEELKAEVRLLKGPPPFEDPLAFDGLGLARHLDEDSLPSSDEELLGVGVGVGAALQDALYPLSPRDARFFRRLERPAKDSEGSSDSDADELAAPYSQGLDN